MDPSLARLVELIPPTATPVSKDWDAVEGRLGTPLPQDYRDLVDTYGGGQFDAHISLLEPGSPGEVYDLFVDNDGLMSDLEKLWNIGLEKPEELQEAGSRVVAWATTDNGENLYWLVRPGQRPADWTVMVNEGRGPLWEHFSMNCTGFLLSILSGVVESDVLGYALPVDEHHFSPAADPD